MDDDALDNGAAWGGGVAARREKEDEEEIQEPTKEEHPAPAPIAIPAAPIAPVAPVQPPTPATPSAAGFIPLVTVVGFHHARGPEVETWFGVPEGSDPAADYGWGLLPFMALSDGAHA